MEEEEFAREAQLELEREIMRDEEGSVLSENTEWKYSTSILSWC